MRKREWALLIFVYLAVAEALSWHPVPDLSLCLIQVEHSEQAPDHNGKKYCPAFHTGIVATLDAVDRFLERHDKSVVGGFTIVLAISTIGLWLATNKLWEAGEKQFGLLTKSAADQSRDMQASLRIAQQSALAAEVSARAAINIEMPVITASPERFSWGASQDVDGKKTDHVSLQHIYFYNHGRSDAYLSEIKCGYFVGDALPPRPNYQFTELINTDQILKNEAGGDVRVSQFEFAIEPDLFNKMRARQTKLWFFCQLVYSDFMQLPHRACFCWERWQSPGAGGFNVDTTEAYNHRT